MRTKTVPMFLFRENYNLLKIERLNGNNNKKWCSTTLENQNKQQWHVWFVKNPDDEILILENKLIMKNVLFDGQQGEKFAPGSAGLFLYLLVSLKYWLFYFSFPFIWWWGGLWLAPQLKSIYFCSTTLTLVLRIILAIKSF